MTQKQLVLLSKIVPIGTSLDETKLSRLIEERPARAPRRRALVKLLSVLYAMDVISCQQANAFWQNCDIGPLPDDLDRDRIKTICQQAKPLISAEKDRLTDQQSTTAPSVKIPHHAHPKTRAGIAVLSAAIVFMLAVTTIILVRQQNEPDSTQKVRICGDPVTRVEPAFLFDQGVSLYTPPENADQESSDDVDQTIIGGLLIPQIRSLGMDDTGLWIGYAPQTNGISGVSHYTPNTREWVQCTGLPLNNQQVINDITPYKDAIFFATDGAGIAELSMPISPNSSWTIYTTDHGLPSNTIYDLSVDEDNQLWASTLEGVTVLAGEYWKVVYRAEAGKLVHNQVHNLLLSDREGNRWFGTASNGLSRLRADGVWQNNFTDSNGLNNIRALTQDTEGGIWVATDGGGVARYFDRDWQVFDTATSQIPSNHSHDIKVDRYGRIWVATSEGVAYTEDLGNNWVTHSTLDAVALALACPTCAPSDDLWIVVREQGIAHADLPPNTPIMHVESPSTVQLAPGESYIFEITVEVLGEQLTEGDGLFSTTPTETQSYGAWPIIPVIGLIEQGQSYTFSNVNDPIIAPEEPGLYETIWRIWQSNRYASPPITIAFEVVDE